MSQRAHVKRLRDRITGTHPETFAFVRGADLARVLDEHERMGKALERIVAMDRSVGRSWFPISHAAIVISMRDEAREALAPRTRRKS